MIIYLEIDGRFTPESGAELARHALRGVARVNQDLIRTRQVSPVFSSRARYITDPPGRETFADALAATRRGGGDCSTLSAWRLGELWARGERDADIHVRMRGYADGFRQYHIMVRRADGAVEDVSRMLGM